VEQQTEDGEARRDDDRFAHVAAWRFAGTGTPPDVSVEPLEFDHVHLAQRSYR
jgi:succinate dehydrogenase / fumarate reductase flavoprotein subunit